MSEEREQLFDRWAETYDRSVDSRSGFPHEGYEQVLDLIATRARAEPGMTVLDLGIGTGNLAERFVRMGCDVWGLDFSLKMLAHAHRKLPQVELLKADIRGDWPIDVDMRFDRVVSGYVLHEFDLYSKVRLMRKLAGSHLVDGGRIVVGDVSFASIGARDEAEDRFRAACDENEHYWAADEAVEALAAEGLAVCYEQVSFCGGVYVIEREAHAGDEGAKGENR